MPKILIVDDDDSLVQLLTTLLKNWGYEVSSAGTAPDGFTAARQFSPDLIILDYHMPGATGAHLFESFRRNQSTANTPILFMSAVASVEDVLGEIADPSRSKFMAKPIHIPEFRKAVEDLLKG